MWVTREKKPVTLSYKFARISWLNGLERSTIKTWAEKEGSFDKNFLSFDAEAGKLKWVSNQ